MIRSSVHNHTMYVDGKNTPREMVEAALAKGFVSLGFSEHALENPGMCGLTGDKEKRYIADVRGIQAEFAGRIRVGLGMEKDFISSAKRDKFEYVIGSVHYLGEEGHYVGVDGNPEKLCEYVRAAFGGDGIRYVAAYYKRLAEYISSYRPDVIGHFDLVRKWNPIYHFFDLADPAYQRIVCEALERMIGSGAYLEVNTGAIARGYLNTPYPDLFALQYWRKLGGKVIFGGDCHQAEKLDCGFEIARELIAAAGYESVMAISPEGSELFREFAL